MSKVTSILDHPDHPANKRCPVDSAPMTPSELTKQMRDFLDAAHMAPTKHFDPSPDGSWSAGPHDNPDKLHDIIARPIGDDEDYDASDPRYAL
jgi:hypothetical protein